MQPIILDVGQQKSIELFLWLKKISGFDLNVWSIIKLNNKSILLGAEQPLYKFLTIKDWNKWPN